MDDEQKLAYRFVSLPYHERIGISKKLNLLDKNYAGKSDVEIFSAVFKKAREEKLLDTLSHEVEAAWKRIENKNP